MPIAELWPKFSAAPPEDIVNFVATVVSPYYYVVGEDEVGYDSRASVTDRWWNILSPGLLFNSKDFPPDRDCGRPKEAFRPVNQTGNHQQDTNHILLLSGWPS